MKRTWAVVDASTVSVGAVGDNSAINLLTNIQTNMDLVPHGVTASAIRLNIGVELVGDAQEKAECSWAVGWVSDRAVAIGGTAIPDPAEESYDWMAFGSQFIGRPDGAAVGLRSFFNFKLESNSMRKQGNGRASLVIVYGLSFMTATTVTFHTAGRVLILGL